MKYWNKLTPHTHPPTHAHTHTHTYTHTPTPHPHPLHMSVCTPHMNVCIPRWMFAPSQMTVSAPQMYVCTPIWMFALPRWMYASPDECLHPPVYLFYYKSFTVSRSLAMILLQTVHVCQEYCKKFINWKFTNTEWLCPPPTPQCIADDRKEAFWKIENLWYFS